VSSARHSTHKQSGNRSMVDLMVGLLVGPFGALEIPLETLSALSLEISSAFSLDFLLDLSTGHLLEEGSTEVPPALKSQA
jgi:hypothetical protein